MIETPPSTLAIDPPRDATGGGASSSWMRAVASDNGGRTALAFLAVLALAAIAAPWLTRYGPETVLNAITLKSLPPSAEHWFGTDPSSRDVFSRMLFGARVSLRIAVGAALLSAVFGLAWGTIAGMSRPFIDRVMMQVVEAFLAVPRLLLVLTVIALWPRVTPGTLILVLGLTGWFGISRLARGETVAVRAREFVTAARGLGVGSPAILLRHVLPHAVGPVLVAASIAVGQVVVIEAGLFFLGVVPEASASWGSVIYDGRDAPLTWWWLTVIPGLFLISISLAVNAIATRLRSAINPRQLHRR